MNSDTGSSPLARGLLINNSSRSGLVGIIPARAGFTALLTSRSTPTWDHPRSRGVYGTPLAPLIGTAGSSPLARGLLGAGPDTEGHAGIIPARAGFTAGRA